MKLTRGLTTAIIFMLALPVAQSFAADAQDGKALFEKNCAGCHGKDGKGNPAVAKTMGEKGLNLTTKEVAEMSDEQALKVISEGAGKMPKSKLTKAEQKQVWDYGRTLGK